jgi:hypothetical protein
LGVDGGSDGGEAFASAGDGGELVGDRDEFVGSGT